MPVSVRKIEEELAAVAERLAELRRQANELEAWEGELRISLRVLQRLSASDRSYEPSAPAAAQSDSPAVDQVTISRAGTRGTHTVAHLVTVRDRDGAVTRRTISYPLATGVPLQAGEALIAMLRTKGDFIKQTEAVERLKTEHGIRIGQGKPGRETSDLSAAIGHGRVPGLVVTRIDGWGLEEWNGVPPARRGNSHAAESAAAATAHDDHPAAPHESDVTQDASLENS